MLYLNFLGKRIRQLRLQAGMSQDALAKKTGYVSRSSINKIELGYTDVPILKLMAFATALEVSPVELLFTYDDINELTEEERKLALQFMREILELFEKYDLYDFGDDGYAAAHNFAVLDENGNPCMSEELSDLLDNTPETTDDLM